MAFFEAHGQFIVKYTTGHNDLFFILKTALFKMQHN